MEFLRRGFPTVFDNHSVVGYNGFGRAFHLSLAPAIVFF